MYTGMERFKVLQGIRRRTTDFPDKWHASVAKQFPFINTLLTGAFMNDTETTQRSSFTQNNATQANITNFGALCEIPSIEKGKVHIVVSGYHDIEKGLIIDKDMNYLFDRNLTNADIIWYRRVSPNRPARTFDGPCGITLHKRLFFQIMVKMQQHFMIMQ